MYDGGTNNAELHAVFPKPIPLKPGSGYALCVVNESGLTIAMYAHVYNSDPALTTPYPIPACAYDFGDGGLKAVPILDNNYTYQMLSGAGPHQANTNITDISRGDTTECDRFA